MELTLLETFPSGTVLYNLDSKKIHASIDELVDGADHVDDIKNDDTNIAEGVNVNNPNSRYSINVGSSEINFYSHPQSTTFNARPFFTSVAESHEIEQSFAKKEKESWSG